MAECKKFIFILEIVLSFTTIVNCPFNSFLQWKEQNPECLNGRARLDYLTPVLEIGVKGATEPFITVDFACTNFDEDENDAMGWRFGWFGGKVIFTFAKSK